MYALVNDIPGYADFLPWCRASEVLESSEYEMLARLHLSWGGISRSFTTRNRLKPPKMIEIRLVDGPFHHLEGFWRFMPVGGEDAACKVALDMEFEFATPFLSAAIGPVFTQITNSLVGSFSQRARQVYGPGGGDG